MAYVADRTCVVIAWSRYGWRVVIESQATIESDAENSHRICHRQVDIRDGYWLHGHNHTAVWLCPWRAQRLPRACNSCSPTDRQTDRFWHVLRFMHEHHNHRTGRHDSITGASHLIIMPQFSSVHLFYNQCRIKRGGGERRRGRGC